MVEVHVVICPDCKAGGDKSFVYDNGCSTTLLGGSSTFYDEQGKKHYHPVNTTTHHYKCSKGHAWGEKAKKKTCWCGWPDKEKKNGGPG